MSKNSKNDQMADLIRQISDFFDGETAGSLTEKKALLSELRKIILRYSSEVKQDLTDLGQQLLESLKRKAEINPDERKELKNLIENLKTYLTSKELKEKESKRAITKKLFSWVIPSHKYILAFGLILMALFLLVFGAYEFNRNNLYVDGFEVCELLKKNGYNGRVFVNKLSDKINFIEQNSGSLINKDFFIHTEFDRMPNVEIAGTGISFNRLICYLKRVTGYKTYCLVGEVTIPDNNSDELELTIRIMGETARTVRGRLNSLDAVLHQAAEYIYINTHPYILAKYQYESDKSFEKKDSLSTIKLILNNEKNSDYSFAYNLWGAILHEQKRYAEALEKYRQAIQANPKYAYPHFNAGLLLLKSRKPEEAIEEYQKGIEIDKSLAPAYYNYGLALRTHGKNQEAIDAYQKAAEIDPNDAKIYCSLGLTKSKIGKYKEAIAEFQKATKINPNNARIYVYWGNALSMQRKYSEAIATYQKGAKIDPNDPKIHENWGNALSMQEKYSEAIVKYQKAADIDPDDPEILENWGKTLWKLGDKMGAKNKWEKAKELRLVRQ